MSTSAGRVLLIPKGVYNSETQYAALDVVTYEHDSYVAKQATQGNAPTNTTYWQAMTEHSSEIQALTNKLTDEAETRSALGAKNLLQNEIATTSVDGMTFIKNADGTITTGGSNTSQSTKNIFITPTAGTTFKKGTYILNGCPSGANGYGLFLISTQGSIGGIYDRGSGVEFTLSADVTDLKVTINVDAGKSIDGLTFKPMIRLATDSDPTYQPYAMTNKELTDVAQEIRGDYVVSERRNVSVNADGTKSYKTLLNELATAFLTAIQGIGTDDYVLPIGMLISNYAELTPEGQAAFVESTKTASSYHGVFRAFDLTSSYYVMHELTLDTTLNSNTLYLYNQGNNTWTNNTDTVPASGNVIAIYYKLYKKIS